jgi:hypothetical protein
MARTSKTNTEDTTVSATDTTEATENSNGAKEVNTVNTITLDDLPGVSGRGGSSEYDTDWIPKITAAADTDSPWVGFGPFEDSVKANNKSTGLKSRVKKQGLAMTVKSRNIPDDLAKQHNVEPGVYVFARVTPAE